VTIFDISYLTTDSIEEGVGSSQILPLVIKLAERGLKVNLLTFEKDSPRLETQELLEKFGISWNPIEFGSHGAFAGIDRMLKIYKQLPDARIFHARSDIPAVAALISKRAPVLWDVRGLWSDQKAFTENSALKRNLFKTARVLEKYSAHNAQAISTLTRSIVPELIVRNHSIPDLRIVVPTAVDLERFAYSGAIPNPYIGLYSGTYNRYYDLELSLSFTNEFRRIARADFHWARPKESPQATLSAGESITFASTHREMSTIIPKFSFGLAICNSTAGPSLKGAVPTKVAEFLACGRPVIVNRGLGDFDELLSSFNAGVIISNEKGGAITAAEEMLELLQDPETPLRCRQLAETCFSLEKGVDDYISIYQKL
jgi:glycosyltransferase involved in cell wall biosynthesis